MGRTREVQSFSSLRSCEQRSPVPVRGTLGKHAPTVGVLMARRKAPGIPMWEML